MSFANKDNSSTAPYGMSTAESSNLKITYDLKTPDFPDPDPLADWPAFVRR